MELALDLIQLALLAVLTWKAYAPKAKPQPQVRDWAAKAGRERLRACLDAKAQRRQG